MRFITILTAACLMTMALHAADSPIGAAMSAWEAAPTFNATNSDARMILPAISASDAGVFRTSEDGTRFLTLRFHSEGASAVRLHLEDMHLPAGARIFVYGLDNGTVTNTAGPYEGAGNSIDADLWTAAVRGSDVVLELQEADETIADLPFRVSEVGVASVSDIDELSAAPVREVRTSMYRGMAVTHEVVDGRAMFEGDIVLGEGNELAPSAAGTKSVSRSAVAITGSRYRWPKGVVPYSIDPTMPNTARITDAIAHWNTVMAGVIKIVPRTTEAAYVYFYHSPSSGTCASSVGMLGYGQYLYVGDSCSKGNMIHELGHAVGLWHEQSREDRNSKVKIHYENISTSSTYNFDQNIYDGDDINAYDYGSVMHYSAYAFSANGQITIETIPAGIFIGQRSGLSAGDIAAIKYLYPTSTTTNPTPTTVAVSLSTNPAGMTYTVDGKSYTAAATFNWTPGSLHSITAANPTTTTTTRYTFQSWSDGGSQTHNVVAPLSATALKATYTVAYQVTTSISGSGTATISPASADTFYTPNSSLSLQATPAAGSCFAGWTNLIAGTPATTSISVTQPYKLQANFQVGAITPDKSLISASAAGGSYSINVAANAACQWSFKSLAAWVKLRSTIPASGSASISISADPNTTGMPRSAIIYIGSSTVIVNQAAN